MGYCISLNCRQPQNPDDIGYCQNCSANLHLQNRYTPSKLLGVSAMSRTFLAWDDQKNTSCVIKQFTPQAWKTSNLKEISARFQQEVERLEQLGRHSQIPSLVDSFSQGGYSYLACYGCRAKAWRQPPQALFFTLMQPRSLLTD